MVGREAAGASEKDAKDGEKAKKENEEKRRKTLTTKKNRLLWFLDKGN